MLIIHNACSWPFSLSSWSFPTYLLAFTCTKWEYCLCIKILKPKLFQMSPLYLPICGITLPFQVNFHVPPLILQITICFVCPCHSWSNREWSVSSMLSGLFSWWVFIHFVIARERLVIGMPSPMIKMKNNETNSPKKLIVWRAPEDLASHGLCLNGWGGLNFTFLLGNCL